ncbi:S-layer protein [Methanothermococcus sp. SCGC AD-155-C09]|nr:S-layer protein [Methanothermococcus sp. SCGC AD-155-C09]
MKSKYLNLIILSFFIILIPNWAVSIIDTPSLVIANKNTPDIDYANMLMDEIYLKRKIHILDNNTVNISERSVYNIPIVNSSSFSIDKGTEKISIKYNIENNKINYKRISYISQLNNDNEITLLGKKYNILKRENNKIILYNTLNNISTTNGSFRYNNYIINLTIISLDRNTLFVDIYDKNNNLIKHNIELNKGEMRYLDDLGMGILFENETRFFKKSRYYFKVGNIITLKDREDFLLNNSFKVDLSNDAIELIYKHPEDLNNSFNIFNFYIKVINGSNGPEFFKIEHIKNYTVYGKDIDNLLNIGDNTFLVKRDNGKISIFKDGKEFKDTLKEYNTPNNILLNSENILHTNNNIILVGGPVSNKLTENISKYLKVPITNDFPGKNMGVIQVIKNPYNPNYKIMVIAGSDRNGTKACILSIINGQYNGEDTLYVRLNGNNFEVIKNN